MNRLSTFGLLAAALMITVTLPAYAEELISHTKTTEVLAPAATNTTTTTTETTTDGKGNETVRVTKTTQPTTRVTTYSFGTTDRALLHKYLLSEYPSNCASGMLDYDGACITTGEYGKVKRTYVIGQPLPTTVKVMPLSSTLSTRLEPAPEGYSYNMIDRDVVLVRSSDNTVTDAVSYYWVAE